MKGFSDDVAWQCSQLGLQKPVVIGHSMGGVVALDLCGRYPDLASGLVMIDSILPMIPGMQDHPDLKRLVEGIGGPKYREVSRASAWDIGCDFDDPARRKAIFEKYILPPCEKIPQHAAYSTLVNCLANYDVSSAAEACKIPAAYISADVPVVNMINALIGDQLKKACPQIVFAKTLLAGHFNTIEVADQVNAMLERFLAVGLNRPSANRA